MKKILLIASLCFSTLTFAQTYEASTTVGNNNEVSLKVSLDASNSTATFTVTGPSASWFGIGYGTTNMTGYAIMHNVTNIDGGAEKEYNMTGNQAPTAQGTQNLTNVSKNTTGGNITYVYTRALNSGDADDFEFTANEQTIDIAYAIAGGTTFDYHGNSNRGTKKLEFKKLSIEETTGNGIFVNNSIATVGNNQSMDWKMYDLHGRLVKEANNASEFNYQDLANGFYILRASSEKSTSTLKVYKK
jgi:hypothetical protein